ncbi:uncharacterized protein LOC122536430 [Frieseomelitta varia]|uniref:uncharacterized protein LOC122536430 n=1 Tax=Frieseomelitta varia TaxID=561572 RepID=UPI001CB6B3E3|nr:uncharacterized protein LOC122536430 [Frieseomelitta varia]
MATPPIQARIPIAEEAYIPPVVEAPTIGAMTPQHLPPFNRENLKLWFLQVEAEQVPPSLYDVLIVNSDADLTTLALLADRVMEFRPNFIASMSKSPWKTGTDKDDSSIQ